MPGGFRSSWIQKTSHLNPFASHCRFGEMLSGTGLAKWFPTPYCPLFTSGPLLSMRSAD